MTNEAEVLRDMNAGRFDKEGIYAGGFWALAAVVKEDIKVAKSSLPCYSHFETSEDGPRFGPRLHNQIPCRVTRKLLLAETLDGRILWFIGGSIPAVELEYSSLGL